MQMAHSQYAAGQAESRRQEYDSQSLARPYIFDAQFSIRYPEKPKQTRRHGQQDCASTANTQTKPLSPGTHNSTHSSRDVCITFRVSGSAIPMLQVPTNVGVHRDCTRLLCVLSGPPVTGLFPAAISGYRLAHWMSHSLRPTSTINGRSPGQSRSFSKSRISRRIRLRFLEPRVSSTERSLR